MIEAKSDAFIGFVELVELIGFIGLVESRQSSRGMTVKGVSVQACLGDRMMSSLRLG